MIELRINGTRYSVSASPEMPLLWALRDLIGLTGTKYGCGEGLCGACVVHVDGDAVRSCVTPISGLAGKDITTIEGLSPDASHPLQLSWIEEHVAQCGYCQPGQIMTAAALLAKTPHPSDDQIAETMSGVICRCGTYQRIRHAIQRAVAEGDVL